MSEFDHRSRGLPAIAIVTHNSAVELRRMFPGQVAVAESLELPLVVVDNASEDGTVDYLREWQQRHPRLTLSLQPRNLGYAGAVNVAFSLLEAERSVLLVNPDVELTEEAVNGLSSHQNANPAVAVSAPRLLFPDGTLQPSARRPASLAAMVGSLSNGAAPTPFRRSYERYLSPAGSPGTRDVDWVIGAAMLIRRSAFEELGGFDQGFFLYMEDADFCRRCIRAGWRVVYVSWVSMLHTYSRASSSHEASVLSSQPRRRHVASLVRYWSKHPGALFGREARRG